MMTINASRESAGTKEDGSADDRAAQDEHHDSAVADAERKAFSSLQAQFALCGYQLQRLEDGALLMTRWGLARKFADREVAAAFLTSIGGPR